MAAISDVRSLENDLHEVISSWLSHDGAIPKRWKEEVSPTKAMPFGEAQALGVAKCAGLVSRARKTALRLKSLSDTLNKLSSAIRSEFEEAQTNVKAMSRLHGLVTIPNEILARIFDLVVTRDDTESPTSRRSKAAVTLSNVCRYFRDTALSCANLWSNICRNKDMASLFLERTKQVPLNAHIFFARGERDPNSGSYGMLFDKLLQDILPHSDRLGGLEVDFSTYTDADCVDGGDSGIRQAFGGFDAPSLHSLHIRHYPHHDGESENFVTYHEFEGWSVPNLRHLETKHYFSLGFSGMKNLQSFDITLDLGEFDFIDIIQALLCMECLKDFRIRVTDSMEYSRRIPMEPIFKRTYFPSIRRLQIAIDGAGENYHYYSSTASSASLMKALFSSLFFPSVTDLHLNMMSNLDWERSYDIPLNKELEWLFQHEDQYPCVERLCLEAIDDARANFGSLTAEIPFAKLPNLKELTLCSNTRFKPSLHLLQRTNLPVLERITIKAIEEGIKTIGPFVASVMEDQKERGNLESFRELVVVNTRQVTMGDFGLEYATRIYEGETALEWFAYGTPEIPTFD
ncbi:hypothetical protein SCHPADRAFT_269851 [Schizopora paradoxa]|uniref:F-box domain-containing protein n=1 Tax=Schizopora paradoxa TaxID=27342 RepID=A0A0H2SE55_9AGAM|nr:hypothetical protein SCHPADRAFT_269851 [Schizopora paradoxa]